MGQTNPGGDESPIRTDSLQRMERKHGKRVEV
jgi:hypothetical protein